MTDHAEALAKALEPFSTMTEIPVQGYVTVDMVRAARSALAAYRSRPAAEVVAWLKTWTDAYAGGVRRQRVDMQPGLEPWMDEPSETPLYATPALAGTEPAGEVVESEDAHVIAAIERELGSWECECPDGPTNVVGFIAAERELYRALRDQSEA